MRRARIVRHRWTVAAVLAVGLATGVAAQERRLGTIGPPPRRSPQRQTSAEGMPPLPLPVVPMRRSEPKAEPEASLFMGKLTYGTWQDYMPNPGDLDNLMRQVRAQAGLWYGQRLVGMEELIAAQQSGTPFRIPLLYLTGYQPFTLTDEERAALRAYVLAGGTVVGDAVLGSPAFAESFREEVQKMFPHRPFDVLQVDHPVFRAFYKYATVHYFEVENGWEATYESPPQFLGLNVGTRTAVILSPFDMSCGWDNFYAPDSSVKVPDAPRTRAMLPGDALRMGINLVSYVAALRPVAEAESVEVQIESPTDRPRQLFSIAQLRHHGDWDPDPNSMAQWLRHLAGESSLAVGFDIRHVDPVESQIAPYPFLFLTGFRDPRLTDEEIGALRRHLDAGGFLFINNCSGYTEFDRHARALVARIFPEESLEPMAADHPLRTAFYRMAEARDRTSGAVRDLELLGVTVRDRLVLVYSPNDAITQLKQVSDPFGNGYDADTCRQVAVNVVAYSLQH